jgi:nifR3 family TIM-barrel protein
MLRVGNVQLQTNALLAPVAGYMDLAYRLIVRRVPALPCLPHDVGGSHDAGDGTYGSVGLTCTELLCPQGILRLEEQQKRSWRSELSPEDRPVCMQLYGADADVLAEAARWAEAQGAALIDINMGCPVDKVTKKNGGSKLLCEPRNTVALAKRVVEAVRVPVTAKTRLGWDDDSIIVEHLPVALCDAGIAMITVHGRTTAQMFKGEARLDGIAQTVEAVKSQFPGVPVIGNGDITAAADASRMIAATGCDGVMVARGAMGRPWLFREIAYHLATGQEPPELPRIERARTVLAHFDLVRELRDDRHAVLTMHKRIPRYSAHLQPWPGLRRAVTQIKDANALRDYLCAGIERIAAEDGGGDLAKQSGQELIAC